LIDAHSGGKIMVTIVVAYNQNFVIGNQYGKVPWHIPDDLKFFKEYTMHKPCIMGRKTWDSIPEKYKPLPGRENFIVTRNPEEFEISGRFICPRKSVEIALETAKIFEREICVIGGGEIYKYFIDHNLADAVLASEIKGYTDVEGTVFFPDLKSLGWKGKVFKEFEEFTVMVYQK
jgi:dihydrofolate reductase